MLIPCPHCGPRALDEFTYLGDATHPRPALDAPRDEWCDFLFARDNPMGRHREHWQHGAGCRAVLVVERDTATHEVLGTRILGPENERHAAPETATALPEPAE